MNKPVTLALLATPLAFAACSGQGSDKPILPSAPPTQLAQVAAGNFQSPTDAVASPDGSEFYFAAFDPSHNPGIFSTSSKPGSSAQEVATGGALDLPIGLVLSCDGSTLYIADLGTGDGTHGEPVTEAGAILAMPVGGGAVSNLNVSNLVRPSGLAMGPDCETLYATGRTSDGTPALVTVATAGGASSIVWEGAPLVAPTGLHVDDQGVAWVMDHLAVGQSGEGVLFQIPSDGTAATEVASHLRMGTPGGVSLTAGGGTAVMATIGDTGAAELTTIDLGSMEVGHVPATGLLEPAGLRTAREAGVFAVVDTEAGVIYRAQ